MRLMNKRFIGNLTVMVRRRREFKMERAEPYAEAVAATGASCAVLTGDFCSTATDEEFEMAARFVRGLRSRGVAVHVLAGNHDVYTFESVRARRFERWMAEFMPPGGYPALATLPGGTSLLLVPTACPRPFSARGRVTPHTVEAVAGLLDRCGPTVVVAAHYPYLSETRGYRSRVFRRLENAEALRRVLGSSGKRILYICGHVHAFSYEADREFPGLEQLTADGFFRTNLKQGTQGEFAEIRVADGNFQVVRHVHEYQWKTIPVTPPAW